MKKKKNRFASGCIVRPAGRAADLGVGWEEWNGSRTILQCLSDSQDSFFLNSHMDIYIGGKVHIC